jgi:hypothetical protein
MNLQFIQDNQGNTTGVFIPIDEWQAFKSKYNELEKEEIAQAVELTSWQKEILDERITYYNSNPTDVSDFNKTIDDLENRL